MSARLVVGHAGSGSKNPSAYRIEFTATGGNDLRGLIDLSGQLLIEGGYFADHALVLGVDGAISGRCSAGPVSLRVCSVQGGSELIQSRTLVESFAGAWDTLAKGSPSTCPCR